MFYFKLSASLILLTFIAVFPSSAQDACVGSPEPLSFTDNFTTHPKDNPAWARNIFAGANNVIGSISGGVFQLVSSTEQINFIQFRQFPLANTVWSVRFDFRFESVDQCSDGIYMLFDHRCGGSITDRNIVELDIVKNGGRDPHDGSNGNGGVIGTGGGISLLDPNPISGGLSGRLDEHLVFSNEHIHCTDFAAGAFKNLRIDFNNGNYKVYLNNSQVLNHTVPVNYQDTLFSIGAFNGADSVRAKIRNLSITSERNPSCPTFCARLPEQHGG